MIEEALVVFGRRVKPLVDRRLHPRLSASTPALISSKGVDRKSVVIDNLSATGFSARLPTSAHEGQLLRVVLPTGRKQYARVVWLRAKRGGCRFISPLGALALAEIVKLWDRIYPPEDR